MIKANAHKYGISALCRCLGIARSTYYYECRGRQDESAPEEAVQAAYDENRRVYGQRKLKRVPVRKGWLVYKAFSRVKGSLFGIQMGSVPNFV